MIKKLLIVLTNIIFLTSQCSVSPDFQFATLDEQIDYAGVILIGKVTNVIGGINSMNNVATLTNVEYYRGCGKKEVEVEGFKGGHLCGAGIPKTGDKVIIFACDNPEKKNLRINAFIPFTGFVQWSSDNEYEVKKITEKWSPGTCRCARRVEQCLSRTDNICFEKKIKTIKQSTGKPIRPIGPPLVKPINNFMNFNMAIPKPKPAGSRKFNFGIHNNTKNFPSFKTY